MKKLLLIVFLVVQSFVGVWAASDDPKQHAHYQMEYRLVPIMVSAYQEEGNGLYLLNDLELWNNYIGDKYPSIHEHFAWDSLSVSTYGQEGDSLIVVLYDFPEPFEVPLAAYGAVVIRPSVITYYTFEMSYEGYYVLGTMDIEKHSNLGFYTPKTRDEFLALICKEESISLLPPLQK